MAEGACLRVPVEHADWWWPEAPADPAGRRGKRVCASCPVRSLCGAYAVRERILHGTWGGVDEWERVPGLRGGGG